jgi:hypothetical protein
MIAFWIQIPDPWRHHPGFPCNIIHFETPSFLISGKAIWRITWADGEAQIGYLLYLEWLPFLLLGRKFWEEACRHELGIVLVFMYLIKHLKKFPNLFGACRVLQISPARKGQGYSIWCILLVSERYLMLTSHQPIFTGEILI